MQLMVVTHIHMISLASGSTKYSRHSSQHSTNLPKHNISYIALLWNKVVMS